MTIFYFIRHGETDWEINEMHKLKGHGRDLPALTETGEAQAKRVALNQDLKAAELIISSPYTRAMHTAAILSKELGLDLKVEFDLREWQPDLSYSFGSMSELKELLLEYEQNEGEYPYGVQKRWESESMLKSRLEEVLKRYLGYSKVIVVGHQMIFQTQPEVVDIGYCEVKKVIREN